jgi:hypothetical protein
VLTKQDSGPVLDSCPVVCVIFPAHISLLSGKILEWVTLCVFVFSLVKEARGKLRRLPLHHGPELVLSGNLWRAIVFFFFFFLGTAWGQNAVFSRMIRRKMSKGHSFSVKVVPISKCPRIREFVPKKYRVHYHEAVVKVDKEKRTRHLLIFKIFPVIHLMNMSFFLNNRAIY